MKKTCPSVNTGHVSSEESNVLTGVDRSRLSRIGSWPLTDSAGNSQRNLTVLLQQVRSSGSQVNDGERRCFTVTLRPPPSSGLSRLASGAQSELNSTSSITAPPGNHPPIRRLDLPAYTRDYYRLEWFWVLEIMTLILVSESSAWALYMSIGTIALNFSLVLAVSFPLFFMLPYIGTFVILTIYHKRIGSFLTNHARLSHNFQKRILRYSSYVYFLMSVIVCPCGLFTSAFGIWN